MFDIGVEPRLEPKEDDFGTDVNGCEIYDGEEVVEWDGDILCGECFMDMVGKLPFHEVAEKFDANVFHFKVVRR